MKVIITLTACLLTAALANGQASKTNPNKKYRSGNPAKKVVFGTVKDGHNRPFKGVGAFVYMKDSTLLASATTGADGKFETNGVLPGPYFVKFVYPSKVTTIVWNFNVKDDFEMNLKMDAPENDTMLQYEAIAPKKVAEVKKGK